MPAGLRTDEAALRRAERTYVVVALILAVSLHALFLLRAGPLWRDEINSVNLARTDSWRTIVANLEHDSFPAGWFVVLRPIALALDTDFALRVFGALVGLCLAAAVTAAGIDMTGRPPVLAVNLLLVNAIVIRFGDSIRAYGVGMLFAVLTYWSLWRYANRRDWRSAAFALLSAIAGVHLLYHNALVVLGACSAAAAACALRGSRRAAAGALAIGAVAAASLVPYAPMFRRVRTWNNLVRFDIDLEWVHRIWAWSVAHSGDSALVLWYAGLLAAFVCVAALGLRVARRQTVDPQHAFHAVCLLVGGCGYVMFLLRLGYYMAPWYFLALLALAAMAVDSLVASVSRGRVRLVVLLLLSVQLMLTFGPTSRYVGQSSTNIDGVARAISARATAADLVIVNPWECGISWSRYYAGKARWNTIPPIDDRSWHRYDLLRDAISSPGPTRSLVGLVDTTLASGGHVWLVSLLDYPSPPGLQPRPIIAAGAPTHRFIAHIEARRYRVDAVRTENDVVGYERCSILEIHPAANGR